MGSFLDISDRSFHNLLGFSKTGEDLYLGAFSVFQHAHLLAYRISNRVSSGYCFGLDDHIFEPFFEFGKRTSTKTF